MTTAVFERLRTATVGGATLAYLEEGEGEPVMLVHGTASDLRTWKLQVPAISDSHRAIAYSRRYARPNEDIAPGAEDPLLVHVDDLAALLVELDAAPAHLVGHSWGAFISLMAAIRHPQLVRSLVLAEPPVLPLFMSVPPRLMELLRLFRRPRTARAILAFAARTHAPSRRAFLAGDDERALTTFSQSLLGKETYERLPAERKQQARENLNAMRAQVVGAPFPSLSDDDVRGVATPTLLVTGERSPDYLLRLSDRLEQLLPNAEHAEIAGASHLMHEQNPAAVNDAVLRFLARQGQAAEE